MFKLSRLKKNNLIELKKFIRKNYSNKYFLLKNKQLEWLLNPEKKKIYNSYLVFLDNKIVGFYCWVPIKYRYFNKTLKCNYQMNMMVDEKYRFVGLGYYLLKKVENNKSDLGITLNVGKEGKKLIEKLDWKIYNLKRYIIFLNRKKIFPQINNFSSKYFNVKIKNYKIYKNFFKVKTIDKNFDNFFNKLKYKYPVTCLRNIEYLKWRWQQHPSIKYKIFAIKEDKEIKSFMVIRVEAFRKKRVVRVLDFLSDDAYEACMIESLIKYSLLKKYDFIDYYSNNNYHNTSLIKKGFLTNQKLVNTIPAVFNPPDKRPFLNFTFKIFSNKRINYRNFIKYCYINKSDADGDREN